MRADAIARDPLREGQVEADDGLSVPTTERLGSALPDALRRLAERRKFRELLRVAAVAGDLLSIVTGFAAGGLLLYRNPLDAQSLNLLAAVLPIYLLIAVSQHAFSIEAVARARVGAARATTAFLIAICGVVLASFFLKAVGGVSRGVFGTGAVLSPLLLALVRRRIAATAHLFLGETTINEVVVQDGVPITVRQGSILLDAQRDGIMARLDNPAVLDRLGRCFGSADRVVVACPPERRALWAATLKSLDVNAEIVASELDAFGALGLARYNDVSTLRVASAPLARQDRVLKRALDLSLATLAIVLLSPVLLLTALAIKLDSRGPILFPQPRVGLGNRVFRIWKFRSMSVVGGDASGHQSTSRNDSRVTRVGRFIRATSIDELPQLFNVLSGRMSIVGPRPHPLESKAENRLFWDIDRRYWYRHAVKPGMTGLAQVRGFRGATEKEADLVNRLQADLEYVAGWSIWRDLSIILRTFRVLAHGNAF